MERWMAVAVAMMLAGCDQNVNLGGRCNAATCKGCCDPQGVCQLGSSSTSCGSNGGMCLPCQAGAQCVAGVCQGTATGGGGGGGGFSGTGGGSGAGGSGFGGGGVGVMHQEVVSGSRLKAISLVGEDGSRMSSVNAFYDSQLQVVCAPDTRSSRCVPARYFYEQNCFTERTCQIACPPFAHYPGGNGSSDIALYMFVSSMGGGSASGSYAVLRDGGWATLTGVGAPQETPWYYRTEDGGCRFDGTTRSVSAATVTPIPITTFVNFTSSHD